MQVERRWWAKKNPAYHFLDIAILLILYQQINVDSLFPAPENVFGDFLNGNGPIIGLLPPVQYPHQLDGYAFNPKLSALNYDVNTDYQTIMDDAHRRIPGIDQHHHNSTNDTVRSQNITALMLQLSDSANREHTSLRVAAEENTVVEPPSILLEVNTEDSATRLDIFNATSPSAQNNISELLLSSQTVEQVYDNGDDIRWQEYLTNDNSTKENSSENAQNDSIDVGFLEDLESLFPPDSRPRTTSEFSDESGIEVAESCESRSEHFIPTVSVTPNVLEHNIIHEDLMLQQSATSDHLFSPEDFNSFTVPQEDADLMQMMYEQDVDLGFDWHNANEPVKQIKDFDGIQKQSDVAAEIDFFVDGETGEHIPIARQPSPPFQDSNFQQNQLMLASEKPADPNNTLNIEECLEILENSIDNVQPQNVQNQVSLQNQTNMIKNLTSLIDNSDNTPAPQPNDDIWQHISNLSELTGLNLPTRNSTEVMPVQDGLNANLRLDNSTNQQLNVPPTRMEEQLSNYHSQPSFIDQRYEPSSVFEPPMLQSYNPLGSYNPPVFSPSVSTPQFNLMSSPVGSDDGNPMDVSFPSVSSPERQEQSYPYRQFNDFSFGMDSGQSPPYGRSPIASSYPEPGQGFFNPSPKHDMSSSVADLMSLGSASPAFANNTNAPFMNPPLAPFQPPPLHSTSPLASFSEDQEQQQLGNSTVDKSAISEYCESDSGISLDQSPRGFNFMGNSLTDETYNMRAPFIKSERQPLQSLDQTLQMQDLKAIQHNHTYNGTEGVKKQLRKKAEKTQIRESRDLKKARELNLPFTLDEIILSPVEEYNELLARTPLNPAQQALVKDIRRRGKNKVAAQNCRKRKIETISNMEEDVDVLRARKQQLVEEQHALDAQKDDMKMRYNALYQQIFSSLRDDAGRPYDPNHFHLEQVEGAVILVPRMRQNGGSMELGETSKVDFSKVKTEKTQ